MCGIIGYIGNKGNCINTLVDGLSVLEYRGYDSAGIAYCDKEHIKIIKQSGSVSNLKKMIDYNIKSNIGIGHTRWATHGKANKTNSHPHKVGKFTIVHNGIVENYNELKRMLIDEGYIFISDTDTEVACALIDYLYKKKGNVLDSINEANTLMLGGYAMAIICDDYLDTLYALKNKCPLIIGVDKDEKYISSDAYAILDKTNKNIELNDGDYAMINLNKVKVFNSGIEKQVNIKKFKYKMDSIDKKGYEHYMLKEIHEQPEVFKKTVGPYVNTTIDRLLEKMPNFDKYEKIRIIACGSATHAALVGKQMIESYANIKTDVEIASEFRYSKPFLQKNELVIVISQSGETADTLEALKLAKQNGNDTLGIINAKGSSIAKEANLLLYTEAGKEIAVATTKAYSAQVAMLSLIALNISTKKGLISNQELVEILEDIKVLPVYMEELLDRKNEYLEIAKSLACHNDIFFIGRKVDYALCMEGSLKLKEISYLHSEAYAAGELKHGTISLIDKDTPVIGIVTDNNVALKTISNIEEVKSRGANVIYITNRCSEENDNFYDIKIRIPKVHNLLSPLLTVIPLQMIAYYIAKIRNCNIDKPKNLAKSVTVE
ncbi:MAG: glutamine--fructose-6-phosphate transaminase (isomerizing) [bacterium]|nr:glutamine--fructose-6-phosphate transaminase (isomerizing) [bacterium]